ncbi:hypothetical protein SAMN04488503_3287 [Humidesulfovibrio mexicanus]|uniref:Uncharacterized protein n=1 Tax=Humidesulfovibrio mexicanus TaxID=147047 RepID=A0A239CU47_9BACT|nr:hypothetical protein [Humidesulfovibrio mexicanus]SNS23630.1 hypothetical protein SAMN04488503_3287 [Humidesulfovibrio mexicanus]
MAQETRPLIPVAEADKPGVIGTFVLGVKVWGREMARLATRQAMRHELRQLDARLRQETDLLARLDAAPGPERDLCLRQVEMLKIEIARLRREEQATNGRRSPQ